MPRGPFNALLMAGLLLLAAGCHQGSHVATSRQVWQPSLAPIDPTGIVVSVGEVPRYEAGEVRYVELTAAECQCLAASNSKLGNLLAAKRRMTEQEHAGPIRSRINAIKREILLAAEMEARNASAAGALHAYYGLAEAEARYDLAGDSIVEVEDTIGKLEQMRQQGLQLPVDDTELVRQRHEMQIGRLELEATINELNHELRTLLGIDSFDGQPRLWPVDELAVVDLYLDPATEVGLAMSVRPELKGLRTLSGAMDSATAAAAGPMLSSINPLLGSGGSSSGLLKLIKLVHGGSEGSQLARQLADYRRDREREIASEVELAVATIQARATQAALASEKMASWEARLEEVEETRLTGQTTFADVSEARLKLLEAQGELVAQAAAWKRAVVDLKKAQGLLVDECRGMLHTHSGCCTGRCYCRAAPCDQLGALGRSVAKSSATENMTDGSAGENTMPPAQAGESADMVIASAARRGGVVKLASRAQPVAAAIDISAEPAEAVGEPIEELVPAGAPELRLVSAEEDLDEPATKDAAAPKAEAKAPSERAAAKEAPLSTLLFGPPPLPPIITQARD